uniref:Uncharacterized protein n=1 Tax=Vespula pensylvanica TaxID=30213 RepID=A0A834JGH9_VESPE|nr:hypothetical protein H0235_018347 [Vespula pensylvanica]
MDIEREGRLFMPAAPVATENLGRHKLYSEIVQRPAERPPCSEATCEKKVSLASKTPTKLEQSPLKLDTPLQKFSTALYDAGTPLLPSILILDCKVDEKERWSEARGVRDGTGVGIEWGGIGWGEMG